MAGRKRHSAVVRKMDELTQQTAGELLAACKASQEQDDANSLFDAPVVAKPESVHSIG